jgi:hypothetical protein
LKRIAVLQAEYGKSLVLRIPHVTGVFSTLTHVIRVRNEFWPGYISYT